MIISIWETEPKSKETTANSCTGSKDISGRLKGANVRTAS